MLYGNTSPEFVLPKIIQFAETYDDTEDQIPEIRDIVKNILTKDDWEWIDESIRKSFAGIAFEANGANINWYVSHHEDSQEALFLWISYLSICYFDPNLGTDSAFVQSGEYLLRSKEPKISFLMLSASYDFLMVYPWHSFSEALFLYLSACIACDIPPSSIQAVKAKLSLNSNESDFQDIGFYELEGNLSFWQSQAHGCIDKEFEIIKKEFEKLY